MQSDLATLKRTLVPGSRDEACAPRNYKIALTVDPFNDDNNLQGYHFYRQDLDGLWSSKPGAELITRWTIQASLFMTQKKQIREIPINRI